MTFDFQRYVRGLIEQAIASEKNDVARDYDRNWFRRTIEYNYLETLQAHPERAKDFLIQRLCADVGLWKAMVDYTKIKLSQKNGYPSAHPYSPHFHTEFGH